jgi:hypothetical protein
MSDSYEHELHILKTKLLHTQDMKTQLITTERNKYNESTGFDITDHDFADIMYSENIYYKQYQEILPSLEFRKEKRLKRNDSFKRRFVKPGQGLDEEHVDSDDF